MLVLSLLTVPQKRFCTALVLLLAGTLAYSAPTKIMCLGNSISEGSGTTTTYRSYLYKSLVSNKYSVDFVGDNKGTCGNRNAGTQDNWDDDHCCFYSAKASQILDGNMPVNVCSPAGDGNIHDWAPKYRPDIAIIHLGTNDCRAGIAAENIQKSLEGIIGELRKSVPEVKIIVSQIVSSRDSSVNKKIALFNASLPVWVKKVSTAKSPVVLVDQWSGWDPAKHHRDQFHPNAAGAKIMAEKFFPEVKIFLSQKPTALELYCLQDSRSATTIRIKQFNYSIPSTGSEISSISLHSLSGRFLGNLSREQNSTYTLTKSQPYGFYLLKVSFKNGSSQMKTFALLKQ